VNDLEIQAQIAANQRLIEEAERAMTEFKEAYGEMRELMAEQLGCSQWDLDQALTRDLSADDREEQEKQALEKVKEFVPDVEEMANSLGVSLNGSTPTAPTNPAPVYRAPRRMV